MPIALTKRRSVAMSNDNITTKGEVQTYADALILQYFEKYGIPDSSQLGPLTKHIATINEETVKMKSDDAPLSLQQMHQDGDISELFVTTVDTFIQKATNHIVKFAHIIIGWNFDTVLESIIYSHLHRAYCNRKIYSHGMLSTSKSPRRKKQISNFYPVSKESPMEVRRPTREPLLSLYRPQSSKVETARNPFEKLTRTSSPHQWQSSKISKSTSNLQNIYVGSYSMFMSPRTSHSCSRSAKKSERKEEKSLPCDVLSKMFQRDSSLANELYNCPNLPSNFHQNEDGTVVSSNANSREQYRAECAQAQSPYHSPQIHTPRKKVAPISRSSSIAPSQSRKLSPMDEFAKIAYGRRVMSASPLLRKKLRSGCPQSAYCGSTPLKISRTSHPCLDKSHAPSQLPDEILEKLKIRNSSLANKIYNCSESSFVHHDYDHNHEHAPNESDFQRNCCEEEIESKKKKSIETFG